MAQNPGSTRRQARERALGLLYEAEAKGRLAGVVVDDQPVPPDAFAVDVARGVEEHRAEIDGLIRRFARGWSLERMPMVDRLLLQMGSYELLRRTDVPTGAVISEAVELAKRFSTEDSSRFVNGVLARIAEEVREPGAVRSSAIRPPSAVGPTAADTDGDVDAAGEAEGASPEGGSPEADGPPVRGGGEDGC